LPVLAVEAYSQIMLYRAKVICHKKVKEVLLWEIKIQHISKEELRFENQMLHKYHKNHVENHNKNLI
jgi:hypothetical protein